jgi:hypothetical protein
METPPSPGAVTLAVVRQDQSGAFAVVTGSGQELSVLPGPALIAAKIYPRTGDLVAVHDGRIVGHWYRALVLRPAPEGVRVRLSTGTQIITPIRTSTFGEDVTLRTGDPVFAGPGEIIARAWSWFEPQAPSPALQAYADVYAPLIS